MKTHAHSNKITVRVNFKTSPRPMLCLKTKATDFLLSHRGGTEVLFFVSRWQKYARATVLVGEQSGILPQLVTSADVARCSFARGRIAPI